MISPNEVLKKYWGHDQLHPPQEKAINLALRGEDTVVLMPTGGGKSVCYQIPALIKPGICLVLSPLISLMQDQVDSLNEKGIKAMSLSGYTPYKELLRKLDNCLYGGYKFLYLSPERLQQEVVQERLSEMNINLVAIDEAHCISEWGHDFRPAYRHISILRERLPDIPFMALTATATPEVLKDIQTNLELEEATVIQKSFERDNISLLVLKTEDKNHYLQLFLKKYPGVSIVYVRNRKLTLNLRDMLRNYGISAGAYHGGLNGEQKEKLLKDWQNEVFQVMVATNAFGMGIDKANVKNVVHYQLTDSLEAYYQEVGRAGRNGADANALLIYDNADLLQVKDQFLKNAPTPESTKFIYKKLNSYFSIAYGEGLETEFNFNFLDFCHTYKLNTYLVYNTLQFLENQEVLILSKEFSQRTALSFKIPHTALKTFLDNHRSYQMLVHNLLRLQGGFFNYKTEIDLKVLEQKSGLDRQEINQQLKKLAALDIIDLTLADQDSTIVFLVPREDNFTINPLVPHIEHYYQSKKRKIDAVIEYVESQDQCKMKMLLHYFGEEKAEDCGKCSICRQKSTSSHSIREERRLIYHSIMQIFEVQPELDSKQLILDLDFPEENILFVLKALLDKNLIKRTEKNTYILN